jgi:ADP-heptose:LPS heptosyltransferase
MHLADALGIPVVALFGQGRLPLWAPSGRRSCLISHQSDPDFQLCHPIDTNAHLGRKFMSRISVEEVLSALKRLDCLSASL